MFFLCNDFIFVIITKYRPAAVVLYIIYKKRLFENRLKKFCKMFDFFSQNVCRFHSFSYLCNVGQRLTLSFAL